MKLKLLLTLTFVVSVFIRHTQTFAQDSTTSKKITLYDFLHCQTSLQELQQSTNDLQEVEVEEMDLAKTCLGQDGRFISGKGYYSISYPGMVFQKAHYAESIGKIRLTKDYKGSLPDGKVVNLENMLLKDVFALYPELIEKWTSRGCSQYWKISNDTLSFFVKIDPTKKPQYPVDEAYYAEKPVEAIDIIISCQGRASNVRKKALTEPLFYVDSLEVSKDQLQQYQPEDIAIITVYKDTSAIKLLGPKGKDGVIYMQTKKYARNLYWHFFKSKSRDYLKVVPSPQEDKSVVYIVNKKILATNYEGDLSRINQNTLVDLMVIDSQELKKKYGVKGKKYGVVIKANL
jgi:hypothetical protein